MLDEDGVEQAVIRDVESLMEQSRENVKHVLAEYYLVPRINRVIDCSEKYGLLKMHVGTDRGDYEFTIKNRYSDIKLLYDGRVLIKDSSDNRYEIENFNALDKKSKKLFNAYM